MKLVHRHIAPLTAMPRHRDESCRITLVLGGSFIEETSREVRLARPGDVLIKPRETAHANMFAPEGAALLSLVAALPGSDGGGGSDWRCQRSPASLRLVFELLEAARANDRPGIERGWACLQGEDEVGSSGEACRKFPHWLRRLREELAEEGLAAVDVAARAREAGVHPVHASRLFRRHFGQSITAYAQDQAIRRAIARIAVGEAGLAQVAQGAGFYDQSHMCRVFRHRLGLVPGRLRELCRAAG